MGMCLSIALTGLIYFIFTDAFLAIPNFNHEMSFWTVVYLILIAPLFEEFLFRFIFYKGFKKLFSWLFPKISYYLISNVGNKFKGISVVFNLKNGMILSMCLSSLLFAAYHGNYVQGFYAFVFGILFCMVYEKTGRLDSPYFMHVVINISSVVFNMGILFYSGFSTVFFVILFSVLFILAFRKYFVKKE